MPKLILYILVLQGISNLAFLRSGMKVIDDVIGFTRHGWTSKIIDCDWFCMPFRARKTFRGSFFLRDDQGHGRKAFGITTLF